MNFEISEEQGQLRDSVARLLADAYGFEQRRAITSSEAGWSPQVWLRLSELGVTGLRIAEDSGGFGGSAGDLLPVLQEFGKALLVEPFLASAVLGATAIAQAADAQNQQSLLPKVASGELVLAWAHDEPATHHAPLWVETSAQRSGAQWRLSGVKSNVLHASAAQQFVVSARVSGKASDRDGLALFLVDAKAASLRCRAFRLFDDSPAGELHLDGVVAVPLGDPANATAAAAIDATVRAGIAAVCADAVGAMEGAYMLTIEYLKTRKQFGRPIGDNQALRHRVAEMVVGLEVARSMAMLAACAIDDPDSVEPADLLRAKLIVGRHARTLCQNAIQLHGGIGMTEEYAVGHYLRRVLVLDQLFGDSANQASRLADMLI